MLSLILPRAYPLILALTLIPRSKQVNFAPSNLATLLPKGWAAADGTG